MDLPGTYAEYLAKLGDDHLDGKAVAAKAEPSPVKESAAGEGKLDRSEEQKKRRNRASQLSKLRDKVLHCGRGGRNASRARPSWSIARLRLHA
jgi:hypothetical protein